MWALADVIGDQSLKHQGKRLVKDLRIFLRTV